MYTSKNFPLQPGGSSESLTSATDVKTFHVGRSFQLLRAMCKIATATVSTGTIVVQFVKRPTSGSATGEVVLATVNIPTAAALGSTYYKDVESVSVLAGQELIVRVLTAAAGGSAAGAMISLVEVAESPETAANQSNLIASS